MRFIFAARAAEIARTRRRSMGWAEEGPGVPAPRSRPPARHGGRLLSFLIAEYRLDETADRDRRSFWGRAAVRAEPLEDVCHRRMRFPNLPNPPRRKRRVRLHAVPG